MATAVQKFQAEKRMTLRRLFESQKPELANLLPKSMSADRLFRLALTEIVKNPALLECSAESWALAMQTCAAMGLYPDSGLGLMYLIPRGGKVTALRGYQGDIALARKSGEVLDIWAEVVYERDTYKVVKGLDRNILHEPYPGDEDPGALKACYAVAKLRGGETAWVSLTKRDVERHKRSAQGTDRADSPWKIHTEQMWKKSAIRELFRWLPKATEEMERLYREDDPSANRGAAIDIQTVSVPLEDKKGLERLKEQLGAGEPAEGDGGPGGPGAAAEGSSPSPSTCSHPDCPPSRVAALAYGKSLVCPTCGEELTNPEAQREPGDEGPEDGKTAVQAIAGAAERKAGQRKLGE